MKTATILIYPVGNGFGVQPDPFKVKLGHRVRFLCEEYDYDVNFVEYSPFWDKHLEGEAGELTSYSRVDKNPDLGNQLKCKYTVTLFDDGKKVGEIDPVIIVEHYPFIDEKDQTRGARSGKRRKRSTEKR
jgi:hypothetical protein